MDKQDTHVGMADMKIAEAPLVLFSLGLGSCVGIALYYRPRKIGGLAHIMLPDMDQFKHRSNRGKFANPAILDMVAKMEEKGAKRALMKAKIVGGARMFMLAGNSSMLNIGERNVEKVKEILKSLSIPVMGEDLGGSYGRSMYFDLETGDVKVSTMNYGEKVI